MKTSIITDMQQSDQVVHLVRTADAEPLIEARLLRRTSIDPPAPRGKTAVNLTVLGRGYRSVTVTPDTTDE